MWKVQAYVLSNQAEVLHDLFPSGISSIGCVRGVEIWMRKLSMLVFYTLKQNMRKPHSSDVADLCQDNLIL